MKNYLFYLWLFLLPFSWLISYYSQFVAVDKLISPILVVFGGFYFLKTPPKIVNNILLLVLLASLLLIVKHISFVGAGSIYMHLMWQDAIKIGYFIIPLLCIRNYDQFIRASWLVVIIALIGCISVFMVAIDVLVLPVERFEISRLGEGGLKKSIGLFTSYGDMAQYVAFAVLWVIVAPTANAKHRSLYMIARLVVFVSVILGLAATQSRNLLFSILLALATFYVFKYFDSKSRDLRKLLSLVVVWFAVLLLSLTAFFFDDLIALISQVGGGLASNTVIARLHQYLFALNLINSSPILGADVETYIANASNIDYIHNMWLRLAAHGGLVTVLITIMLFARIFLEIRKTSYIAKKKKIALIVSSYFIVMLFSSMFYVAMGEMFWALLGIAASFAYIEPMTEKAEKLPEEKEQDNLITDINQEDHSRNRILSYRKTK